jgi:hypothetical protein
MYDFQNDMKALSIEFIIVHILVLFTRVFPRHAYAGLPVAAGMGLGYVLGCFLKALSI